MQFWEENALFLWQLCAAMMSWVGCLPKDSVLPDKWKLGEWE